MKCVSRELDYKFVSKQINLTWRDMLYAVNKSILSLDSVIEHAMTKISQSEEYN